MARVKVEVNTANLQRTLYGSGSQAQRFLDQKAQELARNVRSTAPKDTGALAGSVRVENSSAPDTQLGRPNFTGTTRGRRIVVDHPAAKSVETGTGPAHETLNGFSSPNEPYWPNVHGEFTPGLNLVDWAFRNAPHLIRINKNGTINTYLLQKAIFEHGTEAHHFVLKALRLTFPNAKGEFARE